MEGVNSLERDRWLAASYGWQRPSTSLVFPGTVSGIVFSPPLMLFTDVIYSRLSGSVKSIGIKNYNPMRPGTARTKSSLIHSPYILIRNTFINANSLVLLKILLEIGFILGVLALHCKRLLFPFVKFWITI